MTLLSLSRFGFAFVVVVVVAGAESYRLFYSSFALLSMS
jgi:hypothetical protein